ncbi:MAG: hypothetical protein MJZ63_04225 [Muribaculaceae bacterium]|nr:hypothetical protein [Muribaculaceae bacterium]
MKKAMFSIIALSLLALVSCQKQQKSPKPSHVTIAEAPEDSALYKQIDYDGILNHKFYPDSANGPSFFAPPPCVPLTKLNLQGETLKTVIAHSGEPDTASVALNIYDTRTTDDYNWNFCMLLYEVSEILPLYIDSNFDSTPWVIFFGSWNTPQLKYPKLAIAFISLGDELYAFYGYNYKTCDCLETPEKFKLYE